MTASRLGQLIKLIILIGIFHFIGCNNPEGYQGEFYRESKTGIKNDSIFFDIEFGDSSKDFFNICKEYNQKGILFHGSKNMNVRYDLEAPNDSVSKISMQFYPDFDFSSDIRKIDVEFSFAGWAPWNKHLSGSQLFPFVQHQILEWYGGNDFWELQNDKGEKVWAKIDGNREMKMQIVKDKYVALTITDKSFTK